MSYRRNDTYRIEPPHHDKPPREVKEVTTPSDMIITNGSIGVMAYPCYYYVLTPPVEWEPHSQAMHDHKGWPSPSHPDHICQEYLYFDPHHNIHAGMEYNGHFHKHGTVHLDDKDAEKFGQRYAHIGSYLDMSKLEPIDLVAEGYTSITVSIEGAPEGITCTGLIDQTDTWIVRVNFDVADPAAELEKKMYRFAVRAISDIRTDVIVHGRLIVLPAIL